MKFALENSERIEALPGRVGICPSCSAVLIPKCGDVRIKHWAHTSQRNCDPWHEPEGPWHRDWKAQFPDSWQEIVHLASDGERHIADIKTGRGCVIEFQHSQLASNERRARDAFYPHLLWVVDAARRKADVPKLFKAWTEGSAPIAAHANLRRVCVPENALIRDWSGCRAPVFLDVGNDTLVWMIPCREVGIAYLLPLPSTQFIGIHRDDTAQALALERQWTVLPQQLALLEDQLAQAQRRSSVLPLRGLENHSALRNRRRRRF